MRPRDLLIVFVLALAACTQPLAQIENQQVSKITIEAHLNGREKRVVQIFEPADIKFVTDHLAQLPSRTYDHSSPEFELRFETKQGGALWLRVSRTEIGPGAPGSASNRHWFPKDSVLYDFLVKLVYGNTTP